MPTQLFYGLINQSVIWFELMNIVQPYIVGFWSASRLFTVRWVVHLMWEPFAVSLFSGFYPVDALYPFLLSFHSLRANNTNLLSVRRTCKSLRFSREALSEILSEILSELHLLASFLYITLFGENVFSQALYRILQLLIGNFHCSDEQMNRRCVNNEFVPIILLPIDDSHGEIAWLNWIFKLPDALLLMRIIASSLWVWWINCA